MKANEAPEKLYFDVNNNLIGLYDSAILGLFSAKNTKTSIEYTRTDAFIEKALRFIKTNVDRIVNNQYGVCMGCMDGEFRKYMKEE